MYQNTKQRGGFGTGNKGKSVKNFRNRPGLLIAKIRRRERV
ncbi:hypothetical protein LEP1GSC171_3703 [Leptospira santarosai str. HAI1380]|nr:hypothetical protein LEP1GSC039_2272 [Leptospira santarosai str. 2000027870]EMP00879.1 hypothetical protein LEP1GSC171_3703 [Leptospira santarosai str. HAI1380]